MTEIAPDPIMKIALGFMAAKHLFVASEIGVFEKLAGGPLTLDALAAATVIPPRTLRISADAMVSLGMLEREDGRYRNSTATAAFLAGTPGHDLRPALRLLDRHAYPLWNGLEATVREGGGREYFSSFSEERQQIFSAGVEAITAPAAAALATVYNFGGHRRVLDVAGGTGSFLIAILRRNRALEATLFELPGACAVARQRLCGEPEGARIAVIEGNFFKDPLPDGHDTMLVANTIHVLSPERNLELLRNMRAHAPPRARLLLVDMWMDASRTQPLAAAMMSGEFLLTSGEGQSYAEEEADEWLVRTGWRKLERRPLAGPFSVIIAEAA
jgi:ubiquinone/menaquinone biosynthesis C-methylase UbiE